MEHKDFVFQNQFKKYMPNILGKTLFGTSGDLQSVMEAIFDF